MKKFYFSIIILHLLSLKMTAQKIYSVEYANQANVKVFVVDYENQADKKIHFVNYTYQADLKIYFVKYENQAGWNNKSKIQLMF